MTNKDWQNVGHRLRSARAPLEIDEREAAAGYGVSLRTYRRYEQGRPQRAFGLAEIRRTI